MTKWTARIHTAGRWMGCIGVLVYTLAYLASAGCTSTESPASEVTSTHSDSSQIAAPDTMEALSMSKEDARKLTNSLQRLLAGEPVPAGTFQTHLRDDTLTVYAVLVYTADPDALRAADLTLGSVQGGIATARWTREEIHTAVQMEAVKRITHARPHEPH